MESGHGNILNFHANSSASQDSGQKAALSGEQIVSAPSEAWCILQGESPCRVRVSHPPVSSVAPVAEFRVVRSEQNR